MQVHLGASNRVIKTLKEEKQNLLLKINRKANNKETDKDRILRFFYESNYKTEDESNALDKIVTVTKIARPKAKKILDELIDKKILIKNEYTQIDISKKRK